MPEVEKDTRTWMYGPDEQADIFDRADDAPKGWEDHPAKVKPPVKAAPKQPVEKVEKAEKPKSELAELRKQFKAVTGKNSSPRATADQLKDAIKAAEAPVAE